jgi:hypothetical protein
MSFDLTSMLSWLFDGYWPDARPGDEPSAVINGGQRVYTLQRRLAAGDGADIYVASSAGRLLTDTGLPYILKLARHPEDDPLLETERRVLTALRIAAGKTSYRKYLPFLVESIAPTSKLPRRVNVFTAEPGWTTLEQVHEQIPALDGRHLGWIFKRFLTVLGFIQRQNIVHGAILPCHVMLHAEGHGLQLIGWGQSVDLQQQIETISERYADWYPPEVQRQQAAMPSTDLFMAARCLINLAGGDPLSNRMPDTVPTPMRRFVQSCLLDGPRMRPSDAWAVMDDFDRLLRQLYGRPKFHELTLLPSL